MTGILDMSDDIPDEEQILKIRWKTREDTAGEMCKEVGATWFLRKCLDGWKGSEEHQSPSSCSGCNDGGAFLGMRAWCQGAEAIRAAAVRGYIQALGLEVNMRHTGHSALKKTNPGFV